MIQRDIGDVTRQPAKSRTWFWFLVNISASRLTFNPTLLATSSDAPPTCLPRSDLLLSKQLFGSDSGTTTLRDSGTTLTLVDGCTVFMSKILNKSI